jgi:hypothetical protein
MAKLIVKCWTDQRIRRGRDSGVIGGLEPRYNYLDTKLCSDCRHRSCAAKKGYWWTGAKGQCEKATPVCENDFDKLCKELGAPDRPEFKPMDAVTLSVVAHQMRKELVERYLHKRFLACRAVTITVTEGHR